MEDRAGLAGLDRRFPRKVRGRFCTMRIALGPERGRACRAVPRRGRAAHGARAGPCRGAGRHHQHHRAQQHLTRPGVGEIRGHQYGLKSGGGAAPESPPTRAARGTGRGRRAGEPEDLHPRSGLGPRASARHLRHRHPGLSSGGPGDGRGARRWPRWTTSTVTPPPRGQARRHVESALRRGKSSVFCSCPVRLRKEEVPR